MSRSNAREVAFQLVFEYGFNKEEKFDVIEEYSAGLNADDISYVKEVYTGVCSHYDELAEDISKNSQGFAFERLFNVDKALLILAIYEIKYMASIPFKVSVDEALNLAEKYSTEKSCKYINGILSKFSK